jgi:hypothetical protein
VVEDKRIATVDTGDYSNFMDSGKFAQLQRVATLFADSKLVPEAFRGDMPSTFVALNLAMRMAVDPFMLMQSLYIVHGKPGLEGKFIIAMVNERGPFEGPIQFRFEGEGAKRQCTAYAKDKKTGDLCEATITMEMVRAEGWLEKPGSKWKTMPEQMFKYRSASFLARAYCPGVILGMHSKEELEDIAPIKVEIADSKPTTKRVLDMLPPLDAKAAPVAPQQPAPEKDAAAKVAEIDRRFRDDLNTKKVQVVDNTKTAKRKGGKNAQASVEQIDTIQAMAEALPRDILDQQILLVAGEPTRPVDLNSQEADALIERLQDFQPGSAKE